MAICFTLCKKGKLELCNLLEVDEEICAELDIDVHPERYALEWYNVIGFLLASGKTFQEVREMLEADEYYDSRLLQILDFLEKGYYVQSFSSR